MTYHTEEALCEKFQRRFGARGPPQVVRAPGRINLIGEHTDYNGLPVLPFAIEKTVKVAFQAREDSLCELLHSDPALPSARFEASPRIAPDPPGSWINYTKAAIQDLASFLASQGRALRGLSGLVAGDILQAAGLSSSSALVVATGCAFLAANGVTPPPLLLAERMAEAEKYVGTRGGGMDQATCLLGKKGYALKIDFFPLRVSPVPFPPNFTVLACHSTVRASKTKEAQAAYNLRVAECRAGALLLSTRLGLPQGALLGDCAGKAGADRCLQILADCLGSDRPVSCERLALLLDMKQECVMEKIFPSGLPPQAKGGLQILRRCRHVLTEGRRVQQAAEALTRGDCEAVGRLMNEAHRSAASDYQISCSELDELCDICRAEGALGARLTGAGFGGFAVALVRKEEAERVRAAVQKRFYQPRALSDRFSELCFLSEPEEGARVLSPPQH